MSSRLRVAPARTVGEVVELYDRWAADPYDEQLTQLAHAEQTAAHAVAEGAPDELVAAALLHDVGHLLHLAAVGGGDTATDEDLGHEANGARYLSQLFGAAVCGPIALHVRAKRYLCSVDPSYVSTLSEGSVRSLARQGGPLDRDAADRFGATPGAQDALRLRAWDDAGKVEGLEVTPFDAHRPLLERIARRST